MWPATRWIGQVADLATPLHLLAALANTVVAAQCYLAVASLVWGDRGREHGPAA